MYKLIADWLSMDAQASLAEVQRALEKQNGLSEQPPLVSFLMSSHERSNMPGANHAISEQVFVTEGEEPRLGVFIAEDLLERLPRASKALSLRDLPALDDYCVVAEGVSHFLCLAHRSDKERAVSLFELELQAEVDKFVHLNEKLALEPGSTEQSILVETLFERYALRDNLSTDEITRYREATRHAAKFCHRLSRKAEKKRSNAVMLDEAKSFFELTLAEKIRKAA
jgi:hypothetical protein